MPPTIFACILSPSLLQVVTKSGGSTCQIDVSIMLKMGQTMTSISEEYYSNLRKNEKYKAMLYEPSSFALGGFLCTLWRQIFGKNKNGIV